VVSIIAALAMLSACGTRPITSMTDGTRKVWGQWGPPPATLAAPKGFKVTPAEAYQIVTGGEGLRFALYIFADSTHYYFAPHAALRITTSGYARWYGIRVDGVTGECQRCEVPPVPPPSTSFEQTREGIKCQANTPAYAPLNSAVRSRR
jgi:hypothetical protein